jgi:hypothetical protein
MARQFSNEVFEDEDQDSSLISSTTADNGQNVFMFGSNKANTLGIEKYYTSLFFPVIIKKK